MSGVYWAVSSMALMGKLGMMDKQKILDFVQSCQHPNGGFGGSVGHDPHLLYTLSAVQILAIFGEIQSVDKQAIAKCKVELCIAEILRLGFYIFSLET